MRQQIRRALRALDDWTLFAFNPGRAYERR
jgi:hypothetical protein